MIDKDVSESIKEAKIVEVIRVIALEGNGTNENPMQKCEIYYTLQGVEIGRKII